MSTDLFNVNAKLWFSLQPRNAQVPSENRYQLLISDACQIRNTHVQQNTEPFTPWEQANEQTMVSSVAIPIVIDT